MSGHDTQVLKGILSMLLLQIVDQAEDYGYSVVMRLHKLGFDGLAEGTVYPAHAPRKQGAAVIPARSVDLGSRPQVLPDDARWGRRTRTRTDRLAHPERKRRQRHVARNHLHAIRPTAHHSPKVGPDE